MASTWIRLLAASALALTLTACPKKADPGKTVGPSVSCYIADQHRCQEAPAPDKAQDEARSIECASTSGKLSHPAACPTAGFLGKCTTTNDGVVAVQRWYTGADADYQKASCAEPQKGVWSTTF